MTARLAETIPSSIEFYEFNGQPRDQWPKWLSDAFEEIPPTKTGSIATAHYDTEDGEPEWWRWFATERFWQLYRVRG